MISDTLPEQMKILADGLGHVNIGQRPYDMGYNAIKILIDIKEGNKVEELQYTKLDICSQENHFNCLASSL